ncbi:hypothetical protein P5V15_002914 [Pogonomyrmex californicus]
MIGRADIEGSKSDVAMNAWPPQASYPCDSRIPLVRASSELSVEWRPKRTTTTARAATEASQQGRSAGGQGTGPSSDPGTGARTPSVHLAQARHVSQTRFPTKPDTPRSSEPILIPKLRIQFTDFLTYISLSTRGSSPWRPAADMGTNRRDTSTWLRFSRSEGRSGHRRNCGALRVPNPISLLEVSRELERLYRKENSSRISRRRLQVILGYPDEHSYEGPNCMRFRCRVPE